MPSLDYMDRLFTAVQRDHPDLADSIGLIPAGIVAAIYEKFDAKEDTELIGALQQTVWRVVTSDPRTGVTP